MIISTKSRSSFMVGWLSLAGLIFLLAGCQSEQQVTFIVSVNPESFNAEIPINVILYDADQIALLDRQANCVETADGARVWVECPDGIIYQEPSPELFTFPVTPDVNEIRVNTSRVAVGDQFLLVVSGQYSDRCNQISSRITGIVKRAVEKIELNEWAITVMACIETPLP